MRIGRAIWPCDKRRQWFKSRRDNSASTRRPAVDGGEYRFHLPALCRQVLLRHRTGDCQALDEDVLPGNAPHIPRLDSGEVKLQMQQV